MARAKRGPMAGLRGKKWETRVGGDRLEQYELRHVKSCQLDPEVRRLNNMVGCDAEWLLGLRCGRDGHGRGEQRERRKGCRTRHV